MKADKKGSAARCRTAIVAEERRRDKTRQLRRAKSIRGGQASGSNFPGPKRDTECGMPAW